MKSCGFCYFVLSVFRASHFFNRDWFVTVGDEHFGGKKPGSARRKLKTIRGLITDLPTNDWRGSQLGLGLNPQAPDCWEFHCAVWESKDCGFTDIALYHFPDTLPFVLTGFGNIASKSWWGCHWDIHWHGIYRQAKKQWNISNCNQFQVSAL